MKIPYLKIYPADVLAMSRNLTTDQLGQAVLGICEQAFTNDTAYLPQTHPEEQFFELLTHWKEEAQEALQSQHERMKKARKKRWVKPQNSVGQSLMCTGQDRLPQQPETETKSETEPPLKPKPETAENILTAGQPATQRTGKSSWGEEDHVPSQTLLQVFAGQAAERFEPEVKNPQQFQIWFKRNARCLRDILNFCSQDIPLALQTIAVCARRLQKAGFTGGYEAVCRNLPEYYAAAKVELEDEDYAD